MLHSWEKIPRSHTSDPEEVCQLSSPPCHLFEIKFEGVDQIAQSSRALPHPRSAMSLVFASALARPTPAPVAGSRRIAPGAAGKPPRPSASPVVAFAKKKGKGGSRDGYDDWDDGFGSGSGNYGANFNSIDDDFYTGAGGDYDSFGSKSGAAKPESGKKKGAAKRAKKAKGSDVDDGYAPVAGDVSRLIRSKAPAKPESGAIGSSLDSGDGPNFVRPLDGWKKKGEASSYGDVFENSAAFSMDDGDLDFGAEPLAAEPIDAPRVVTVAKAVPKKEKREEAKEAKAVDPADPGKGEKKASQTLKKWGFAQSNIDDALGATEEAAATAVGEGQTAYNKRRQVLALDWLLLNAPEDAIPMDYRNDAIKARS